VDHIEGDLIEVHRQCEQQVGRRRANWRLAVALITLFRPDIIRPLESPQFVTTYSMYKSFVVVAWRNFLKSKGYSSINILGLTIALSACMLIGLYVQHELNFDRFNLKSENIYRANYEVKFGDNLVDVACAGPSFASTAKADFPQIEEATRIKWFGGLLLKLNGENVRQSNVAYADSTLFDIFTIPIIQGSAKTALNEPNTIVLTESVARKLFGSTDVVGNVLTVGENKTRKVTAVIEDLPSNSHFRFECFLPMIDDERALDDVWAGGQIYSTYFLLRPDADVRVLERELNKMLDRHVSPELKKIMNKTVEEFESHGDYMTTSLTPLVDIHLHSNRLGELFGTGKIEYVYMFSAIAIFILLIAVINFMNLATARSARRAREVGVRKVLGSVKSSLIQQFIMESMLTCALAMILAFALTAVALPSFNSITGKTFDMGVLYETRTLVSFVILMVAVGVLAGSYPAFYLSAFQPVQVLKGGSGGVRSSAMRNALVVFQFVASVVMIAGTIVVMMQMNYISQRDLGFSREQVLIIGNGSQVGDRMESLKNSLLTIRGVKNATVSGFFPVSDYRSNNTFFRSPTLDISAAINMQEWQVDDQYITTMGMQIAEGRDFSRDIASDSTAIIVNESAARFLGEGNIIGKKFYTIADISRENVTTLHVIGVVKDFNFSTLRDQVAPLAFVYGGDQSSIALKLSTEDITSVMRDVEAKWKSIAPELPFEYSFMNADFDRLYDGERQASTWFTIFASLSIFIACMGLLGLATFMAERRTKEIGIRKVLGASVYGITSLLSTDFLKMVVIAVILATPLSWYLIGKWLDGFAYRVDIAWWVFPLAGLIAVFIAFVTVSYQSVRAAVANPVDSLRTE